MKQLFILLLLAPFISNAQVKAEANDSSKNKIDTIKIEAKFAGGVDGWRDYLMANLKTNVPLKHKAPAGRYTVVVSFIVDKEGNISEVNAANDPGYGTAQEAVRVIKKGPKWKPATINGKPVIYRQKQSITFDVSG